MLLIRRFEERCAQIYVEGQDRRLPSPLHRPGGRGGRRDEPAPARRLLHHLLPRPRLRARARHRPAPADGRAVRARSAGISRGKGGSMHFYDVPTGNFGGDGIVGGHLPLAAGMGYAIRLRGHRAGRALLLRRRRGQRGRLPRGAQRQRAVGPAGRLHHREQPLRHGHLARPRLLRPGPLPARQRVRHPAPRRERHGAADGARRARRGDRPRAQGEAALADRGRDLPLPRPLDVRPGQVPHQGGGRGDDAPRPDPALRRDRQEGARGRAGGARGDRQGRAGAGGRGGALRRAEPLAGSRDAVRGRLRALAVHPPRGRGQGPGVARARSPRTACRRPFPQWKPAARRRRRWRVSHGRSSPCARPSTRP